MIKFSAYAGSTPPKPEPVFKHVWIYETWPEYFSRIIGAISYMLLQASLWTGIIYCVTYGIRS